MAKSVSSENSANIGHREAVGGFHCLFDFWETQLKAEPIASIFLTDSIEKNADMLHF